MKKQLSLIPTEKPTKELQRISKRLGKNPKTLTRKCSELGITIGALNELAEIAKTYTSGIYNLISFVALGYSTEEISVALEVVRQNEQDVKEDKKRLKEEWRTANRNERKKLMEKNREYNYPYSIGSMLQLIRRFHSCHLSSDDAGSFYETLREAGITTSRRLNNLLAKTARYNIASLELAVSLVSGENEDIPHDIEELIDREGK